MKILATSDLHNRRDWYAWLLKQAPTFDAVIIAGDLLDMFADDLYAQVAFLGQWIVQMRETGTHLLLCDGNHDFNGQLAGLGLLPNDGSKPDEFVRNACVHDRWMDAIFMLYGEQCVVGGATKNFPKLDNLIVTSLPYDRDKEDVKDMLLKWAAILRSERRPAPLWIVLHHEPPLGKIGGEGNSSLAMGHWIEEYQPRMVFCGHDHKAPYRSGTCCERVGLTYVFNPGHNPEGTKPSHIVLETKTMKFTWHR